MIKMNRKERIENDLKLFLILLATGYFSMIVGDFAGSDKGFIIIPLFIMCSYILGYSILEIKKKYD